MLRSLVKDMQRIVDGEMSVTLAISAEAERRDAFIDLGRFFTALEAARARLNRLLTRGRRADRLIQLMAGRLSEANARELGRQLGIDFPVDDPEMLALLNQWRREQLALVTSIPRQYLDKVHLAVTRAATSGMRAATLAKRLQELAGITLRRAELIARDQIATGNARVTQLRHRQAGITRYRWVTSRDERVRSAHNSRDGQVFSYDSPPSDGHPGEAINCRCVAQPILD